MSRIKYFDKEKIAVYIYGEKMEKHHSKHIFIVTTDDDYQYGFDGNPLKCSKRIPNNKKHKILKNWILNHQKELDQAWEDVNNGVKPSIIED